MNSGIDPRARDRILTLEREMRAVKRELGDQSRRIAALEYALRRIAPGPETDGVRAPIELERGDCRERDDAAYSAREKRAQLELEHANDGAPRTIGAAGDVGWTDGEGSSS